MSVSGLLIVALALGCSSKDAPEAPPSAPATVEKSTRTAPTPPAAEKAAQGWGRAVPDEPSPAAKGLYRRAVDLQTAGNLDGARALLDEVAREYGDTRFGARLTLRGPSTASTAAVIGLVGGLAAPFLLHALQAAKPPQKKVP